MKPRCSLTIAVACSLILAAPWAPAQEKKEIKKGLKIAFIPKNINNPYNVIETGGSLEACKEMGIEGKVVGPSDASASSQVSYINTMITQRQSAIVLAANDPNALLPYGQPSRESKSSPWILIPLKKGEPFFVTKRRAK